MHSIVLDIVANIVLPTIAMLVVALVILEFIVYIVRMFQYQKMTGLSEDDEDGE